jgi:carbon monoxide dehydrogenase subunit G
MMDNTEAWPARDLPPGPEMPMRSLRNHVRIARPAEEVWNAVRDGAAIEVWMPGVTKASVAGGMRHVEFVNGFAFEEVIVNCDDQLRRFQYQVVSMAVDPEVRAELEEAGVAVDEITTAPNDGVHTIDVIEDGDGALVIYSLEKIADDHVEYISQANAGAVQGLKAYLER